MRVLVSGSTQANPKSITFKIASSALLVNSKFCVHESMCLSVCDCEMEPDERGHPYLRLEVSVDNSLAMHGLHGMDQLQEDTAGTGLSQTRLSPQLLQ